jgi:quercetin dioxygenase-like cupin family protein
MECLWVFGQRLDLLATGESTGGRYCVFHVFLPPGPDGPIPHRHRHADEFFYILEGRVELLLGDAWRSLGPGELLHVPRGTSHTFGNATAHPARMLSGFVPAGFERFFRDFGCPARPGDVDPPPVQEPDLQRLAAMAGEYDMELVSGPAPPAHDA